MRPRPLVLLVALGLSLGPWASATDSTEPSSSSDEDPLVLIDDAHGTFAVGLLVVGIGKADDDEPVPDVGAPAVNLARWGLTAPGCERDLRADITYTQRNLTQSDDAPVEVPYRFVLRATQNDTRVEREVHEPGTSIRVGTVPAPGPFTFDLEMETGLAVEWNLTLRASRSLSDPDCQPDPLPNVRIAEVEADPIGPDPGEEWVELWNAGTTAVDLSDWTLHSLHGATATVTVADGTVLAPDERWTVGHDRLWLDNVNESVELRDPAGAAWSATPWLSDQADDGRSWQLADDGTWTFLAATPEGPTPSASG